MRPGYEVEYQPEYQAGCQPEGRAHKAARRLIPSLIQGLILERVPPLRVVLYLFTFAQISSRKNM